MTTQGGALVGSKTNWTLESGNVLTVDTPLVLSATSDSGVNVRRTITVAGDYMFRLTDELYHTGTQPVTVAPIGDITGCMRDSIRCSHHTYSLLSLPRFNQKYRER